MNILLDMDGVLADFVSSSIRMNGIGGGFRHDDIKEWNYFRHWDMTEDDFWKVCSGYDFWFNIDPYPWAKSLYEYCCSLGTVTIATAPSLDPQCVAAKIDWLQKHLGINQNSVMCGKNKWLMANPGTVLIDDGDHNIAAFEKVGGRTVLFPQRWNSGRELAARLASDSLLEFVCNAIKDATKPLETDPLLIAYSITSGDRQNQYGPPDQDFRRTAEMWSGLFRDLLKIGTHFEPMHVALAMIQLKCSRQLHQRKLDNWVDIAGYARCGNICDLVEVENEPPTYPMIQNPTGGQNEIKKDS